MRPRPRRVPVYAPTSAAALLAMVAAFGAEASGCARDHGVLAASGPSSAAAGGAGGEAAAGAGGSPPSASGGGAVSSGAGGSNEGAGPAGPSRLTVLDGIVDADGVRICFLPYPAGDPAAMPWPNDAAGLPYGAASLIDLPGDVIPGGDGDVQMFVVGGDLALSAGKPCEQILAEAITNVGSATGAGGAGGRGGAAPGGGGAGGGGGAPPLPSFISAASLGLLPASTFTSGRSLLLAPVGCLGGPGHDDDAAEDICGAGYTSNSPTARLVALALSRISNVDLVGLQIVHASVGSPPLYVNLAADASSVPYGIAPAVPLGGVEPAPPYLAFDAASLVASGYLTSYDASYGTNLGQVTLGAALSFGDLGGHPLEDGHDYAFVAIGASATVMEPRWWKPFTFATIRSDP